jgi:hypothetical protein
VAPDVNKIAVFNSGIERASNALMPFGGHTVPISKVGASDAAKKAQKKAKKNITSETINKITQ